MTSTPAERERAVAAWKKSGLPAWRYAEQHGLNTRTLEKWAARVRRTSARPPVIEVKVPTSAPSSLEVVVGAFRVLVPPGFDAATLQRLVAALEGR